jgi:hypothetical protein
VQETTHFKIIKTADSKMVWHTETMGKDGRPHERWTDEVEIMGIRNLHTVARDRKQQWRTVLRATVHNIAHRTVLRATVHNIAHRTVLRATVHNTAHRKWIRAVKTIRKGVNENVPIF